MKTVLAFALAALSTVAAQAVTSTWTGSTSTITAEVTSLDAATIASSKNSASRTAITTVGGLSTHQAQTYVVGIIFDGSAASDIIRYSNNRTYDGVLSMGFSASGLVNASTTEGGSTSGNNIATTWADGVDASTVSKLITSGNNTLVTQVVVTPSAGSGSTLTTVTYYLNGVEIGSTFRSGGYNIYYFYLGDAVSEVYYASGTSYASSSSYTEDQVAEMTAAQIASAQAMTDVMITNLVPEPTCLALLALGVAGIALRRRAA